MALNKQTVVPSGRARWRWLTLSTAAFAVASLVSITCLDRDKGREPITSIKSDLWSTRWENLGGDSDLTDPAFASWAPGRLDAFWRGTSGTLQHRWTPYNGGGWSYLEDMGSIGGSVGSAPAAVSKANGEIDVFTFDASKNLVHWSFTLSTGWVVHPPIAIPQAHQPITGGRPTVASWTPGRLDVFWRGSDDLLKHVWRPSLTASWTSVEPFVDEILKSDPAAISTANGKIDLFWKGSVGELRHKWFPSCSGCGNWALSTSRTGGGVVNLSPAVASWDSTRLDVFWKGNNNELDHIWRFSDGTWWTGGVENLGGDHATGPGAVSWGPSRIDVLMAKSATDGSDVDHLTWQTTAPTNPLFGEAPRAPTIVQENQAIVTGDLWEFSAAASPPGTPSCLSGAFVASGEGGGIQKGLFRVAPLTSTSQGQVLSSKLVLPPDTFSMADNVMTRAKNGDLLLLRTMVLNNSCVVPDLCSGPLPPGCANPGRDAVGIWRSTDCGKNWSLDAAKNLIDPILPAYGNGTYALPCRGGWDRPEIYYDYFSDRLFMGFAANPGAADNSPFAIKVLRSNPGTNGDGPFTMHTLSVQIDPNISFDAPVMMTSLPGRLFFFTCAGDGHPKLRWIDPNASWPSDIRSSVGGYDFPTELCKPRVSRWPNTGLQGSDSVTRVATYTADDGMQWWIVRVAFGVEPVVPSSYMRVLTVRVNAPGTTVEILAAKELKADTPPNGQAFQHALQMTAIEPYPIFDSSNHWTGENTTVYYWREEFWNNTAPLNQQNTTRAIAVRDIGAWGSPIVIGSTMNGNALNHEDQPGDYSKGAFWYDATSPETPLRYLILRADIPASASTAKLRSTILAFPRGLGSQ